MTPTPTSSNNSPSNHNSPDGQFRVIRKRNRIPLSCGPCRHRKLKCNRQHPCDNCIKRGDVSTCAYAAPTTRKKNSISSPTAAGPDEMQNRIDRLENLVLSLMTNGPQSAGPKAAAAVLAEAQSGAASSVSGSSSFPVDTEDTTVHDDMDFGDEQDAEVEDVAKSIGVMKVDGGKSIYISEAHWYSILAEISEVKTFFNENKKLYEDQYKRLAARSETQSPGHGVFFITYPMSTKTEILRSFPPKGTTDVLIARFFDVYNQDPPFQIIHGPTYQKQYDQHWRSPQDSDIVWLGLTYAMMMVSLVSYSKNSDEPAEYRGRTEQMYKDYKRLTAQSLMLTDFNKGSPYLLEMYIFYILADLGRSKDAEINILVGTATLVRHAMRLGYHRDSKYFPNLSAFQGEMRRRVWALVKHADLRISAQFGLPPMVRNELANTEMMRNLFDDELDENVAELPESRPLSEATPISYLIYKTHMVDIAYEIVEETQKLGLPSYEKAMELDRKIRKLHEEVPLQFKFRPYEESIRDPSDIIMKRYILEIMYLKFLLLIHRKFCNCTRYPYSARTGLESAMQILKHQQTLHHESRQGRRLSDAKMFVTSLTAHDYILAAMIVCMALYRSVEDERAGRSPFDPYDRSNRPNMMAAIEGSLRIWDSQKEDSMEAFKATGILTAMTQSLRNYQDVSKPAQPRQPTTSPFGTSPFSPSVSDDIKLAPEHSAAMTLNMLSSGAMGSGAAGINLFGTAPSSFDAAPSAPGQTTTTATTTTAAFGAVDGVSGPASPFSSLFGSNTVFQPLDVQSNLDWESWDSYMGGNPLDTNSIVTNIWPMNLDPAMDPSASTTTDLATSTSQQTGASASSTAQNGYGGVFMGS